MATRHAGWHPGTLRSWREAHGLGLEAAGERLRGGCEQHGLTPPAGNFQTLWRHERGEVYPGPHYRRAYCLLYSANEAELGFRPALPGEPVRPAPHRPATGGGGGGSGRSSREGGDGMPDGEMRRRDFLRTAVLGGTAALGGTAVLAGPAIVAGTAVLGAGPISGSASTGSGATDAYAAVPAPRDGEPSERESLQELALRMTRRRSSSLHRDELPPEVLGALGPVIAAGYLLRADGTGTLAFAHPSLIDFFVAAAMAADLSAGRGGRLTTVQTSHDTDQIIKDMVAAEPAGIRTLRGWMRDAPSPVLRVNSAGILAKLPDPAVADESVRAIRADASTRRLYLTAVVARTAGADWSEAGRLAAGLDPGSRLDPRLLPAGRLAAVLDGACADVGNPRDAAARWCSVLVLGRLREYAPQRVAEALHGALGGERSVENRRAIGRALAGGTPAVTG